VAPMGRTCSFRFSYAAFSLQWEFFCLDIVVSERTDGLAGIKLAGYSMLVAMVPTLLTLWQVPDVRGAIPPGGCSSSGLRGAADGFNTVGANLVAVAIFFAGFF